MGVAPFFVGPIMRFTLTQLEQFVSSAHYDSATAGLIARGVPTLKAADGELISPGVRRIRGNLCNVHGRYGPCDKALSGKKKPGKARQTPAQRAQARTQQRAQNIDDVAKRMAATDTGLGPSGSRALSAFAQGTQPDAATGAALVAGGLAEQGADGSFRMTPTGRAVVNAMAAGDYQRAIDGLSRAADTVAGRQGRATAATQRQTAAQAKRTAAAAERSQRRAEREAAQRAKKPAKASSSGGSKQPEKPAAKRPARQQRRGMASGATSSSSGGAAPKPEKAPAKQIAPALQTAADQLSAGATISDADTQALIRNGLAKLNKEGELVLTAAGMRATQKSYQPSPQIDLVSTVRVPGTAVTVPLRTTRSNTDLQVRQRTDSFWRGDAQRTQTYAHDGQGNSHAVVPKKSAAARAAVCMDGITVPPIPIIPPSFKVFKDANGQPRWVAQSSTAFQDRDKEIVSTKALADDCRWADTHDNAYGPLRWWHTPGLDLGDCDFNAMHGRVLIESGTFRSPAIAQKVALAANGLEISLGFIHLPNEPDADGVFHHIRRFERSLVPRGKASNRFTAFTVKESRMFDPTKVAALKTLGFSDDDITSLQSQAEATEKAATDQGIAFKADEPAPPEEITIGGVVYAVKAFPPKKADDEPVAEAVIEADAFGDAPIEEEAAGGLTLSPEDIAAIGSAVAEQIGPAIAQVMGALELEKKVAGHVQGLLAPYQATKDAEAAQTKEQLNTLATQVADLTGSAPAAAYRPSAAKDNVLTDATMLAAAKQLADPSAADPWADIKKGLGLAQSQ